MGEEHVNLKDYSLASYYTESLYESQQLSKATSFIYSKNEKDYIVTNWHVVSGKNFETNEILHSMSALPNRLKIRLFEKENDDKNIFNTEKTSDLIIDLYDDEDNPRWTEMKINDKRVDVVIIPITIPNKYNYLTIQEAEEAFNDDTTFEVGEDVFILGYPFGLDGGGLPIWKRASVASEPEININGLPMFYVDTASRQGMSGSPVVLYKRRNMTLITSIDGGPFSRYYTKLIGVYSGRIGAKENDQAQLGLVWKPKLIEQLIEKCNK